MSTLKRKRLYLGESIPLHYINVFRQVRMTFNKDDLQELADDIAVNGILQPSIVAKLDEENFETYKKTFEELTGEKISNARYFKKGKQIFYYVLIAGERRYRAHKILWDTGCTLCKEKAEKGKKILQSGNCYQKHFGNNLIEVRSCLNIDPIEAKGIQFRENNYVKPNITEEAEAYQKFLKFLRKRNPKISIQKFAEQVGVSAVKIRKALWFCELPEEIQGVVRSGLISYSNALEFKRILDLDVKKDKKEDLLGYTFNYLCIHPKMNVKDFKKKITEAIDSLKQISLFELPTNVEILKAKRKVVEGHLITQLTTNHHYASKVALLYETGQLGKGGIFSDKSPKKQILQMAVDLTNIVPGFNLTELQKKLFKKVSFEKIKT